MSEGDNRLGYRGWVREPARQRCSLVDLLVRPLNFLPNA